MLIFVKNVVVGFIETVNSEAPSLSPFIFFGVGFVAVWAACEPARDFVSYLFQV